MHSGEKERRQMESFGRRVLRRVPDAVIAICVVIGALLIGTGYRWAGVAVFCFAILVGWKRDWCAECAAGISGSSRSSSVNQQSDFAESVAEASAQEEGGDN
jgi:cobalamin synthase